MRQGQGAGAGDNGHGGEVDGKFPYLAGDGSVHRYRYDKGWV